MQDEKRTQYKKERNVHTAEWLRMTQRNSIALISALIADRAALMRTNGDVSVMLLLRSSI